MTLSLQGTDESYTQPDRAWESVCLPASGWALGMPAGNVRSY